MRKYSLAAGQKQGLMLVHSLGVTNTQQVGLNMCKDSNTIEVISCLHYSLKQGPQVGRQHSSMQ